MPRHYLVSELIPETTLEWLALMQHHGAPTRLLDWTWSPYVAAYFALEDAVDRVGGSVVWAIDIEWSKSAAVKKIRDRKDRIELSTDLGTAEIFDNLILKNEVDAIVPVLPTRSNQRLSIQQGLFLCQASANSMFSENVRKAATSEELRRKVLRIVVPNKHRAEGLADLWRMNINRRTLFPGIDGFAQSLRHRVLVIGETEQIRDKVERGLEQGFLYS